MKFRLEIVTPERLVYSEDVDVLTLPTVQGEISILAKHVPLVSIISPGEIKIKRDNEVEYMAITGGFVQVLPHKVIILADAAERAEEIDLERAMRARERAQKLLEERRGDKISHAEAMAAFQRALVRIKVGQRKRKAK
jgi:F-type H+-transporting ATPase subunit epsilon|uniref:ATP synthase epsilon chain n=1 Tax=candidate division WOR-3 bacterium TaxID=2052148 RepID=A0A7V3RFU8_UNCW3